MIEPVTEEVLIDMSAHGHGRIVVNGIELQDGVSDVAFRARAGGLNEVTITLISKRVTIKAPAHVTREGELPEEVEPGVIETTSVSSDTREFARADG